jgi:hypothetical protein
VLDRVVDRDLLGWQPAGPGLIADLKEGHYFLSATVGRLDSGLRGRDLRFAGSSGGYSTMPLGLS